MADFVWHPYDPDQDAKEAGLKDHYFYLVTHREYSTPLKARFHYPEEVWQVYGATLHCEFPDCCFEFWYSWDEDNPILAWMEMPEIYKEETNDG